MEYIEEYMANLKEEHRYLYSRLLFEEMDFHTRAYVYVKLLETKVEYYRVRAEAKPDAFVELHLN